MAFNQATIDALHSAAESDGTLTSAQKAVVQHHCYLISQAIFGSNATTTVAATIGGKSGRLDGRLG